MEIAIGADHNGVALKAMIKEQLIAQGHNVSDFGPHYSTPTDFPDSAVEVGEAVANGAAAQGILICGNGVGMTIAANKIENIRAALCHDLLSARQAREHNNTNVLCLGGLIIGDALAQEIVQTYLTASYKGDQPNGERYARRVGKIENLDKKPRETV